MDHSSPQFFEVLRLDGKAGSDPLAWAAADRDRIRSFLLQRGAVLIRGLTLTRDSFGDLGRILEPGTIDYTGGIGPRHLVARDVYTSTDLPPQASLAQHNEMAYHHQWPMRIFFLCEVATDQRGATTVCDSRGLLARMPREMVERFRAHGVRYIRNYFPGMPYKSIEQTFGTNDPMSIDAFCAANGIQTKWLASDHLQLLQHAPAIRVHPLTGDEVFFNTMALWHPVYWRPLMKFAYPGLPEPESEDFLWQNAKFGDDTPIPDEWVAQILSWYQELELRVQWQPNDVLYIDNMLASHGRESFSGKRSVLAAFRAPVTAATVGDFA